MSNAVNKFKPDWLHLVPPGLSMKEDMEHVGFSQDYQNGNELFYIITMLY
jgi:hypothetical protein